VAVDAPDNSPDSTLTGSAIAARADCGVSATIAPSTPASNVFMDASAEKGLCLA
jgi:hypothetical protein